MRFSFVIKLIDLVNFLVILVLSLRFVLRILGANTATPFVQVLYEKTDILAAPFMGIFPSVKILDIGYFDFSTFFAMGIYFAAGCLLSTILSSMLADIQLRKKHTILQKSDTPVN